MKRLKKRILLIPAVFVILTALCVYLFFGANQINTDADIRTGENGTKSLQEENRTPDGADQAMNGESQGMAVPADITAGTQSQRGFLNDNTLWPKAWSTFPMIQEVYGEE